MEISMVRGTTPQIFNAMMFPELSHETKRWIQGQFERGVSAIGEAGKAFVDRAVHLSSRYFSSAAATAARGIARNLGGRGSQLLIQHINNPDDLKVANIITQRYMMAEPTIRRLFHKQLCDGYSGSYFDQQPSNVGETHYEYRRVMDGMVQERGSVEEGDYEWFVEMFPDQIREGDRELDIGEQVSVLRGWNLIQALISEKKDPTCPFGSSLEI